MMNEVIITINNVLNKFYGSIESEGYSILQKISIINKNIFLREPLKTICSENVKQYITLIINSIIFAYIIYYFFKLLLSLYSNVYTRGIYVFIIKVIVTIIIARSSYDICKEIININYMFTEVVDNLLKEICGDNIDFSFIKKDIKTLEQYFKSCDKLNVEGIEESITCFYVLNIIIVLSVRYVIVILCIILSPFCILTILSKDTEKVFKTWIKVFTYNLIIQIINKFILFIPIISRDEKELSSIIFVGVILVLYRINKYIGDFMFIWKK